MAQHSLKSISKEYLIADFMRMWDKGPMNSESKGQILKSFKEAENQKKGVMFGGTDIGGGGILVGPTIRILDALEVKWEDLNPDGPANVIGIPYDSILKLKPIVEEYLSKKVTPKENVLLSELESIWETSYGKPRPGLLKRLMTDSRGNIKDTFIFASVNNVVSNATQISEVYLDDFAYNAHLSGDHTKLARTREIIDTFGLPYSDLSTHNKAPEAINKQDSIRFDYESIHDLLTLFKLRDIINTKNK